MRKFIEVVLMFVLIISILAMGGKHSEMPLMHYVKFGSLAIAAISALGWISRRKDRNIRTFSGPLLVHMRDMKLL